MRQYIRNTATYLVVPLFLVISVSACGSNDAKVGRTRNATSVNATCAEGGECVIGDTGPGGGTVFYVGETEKPWGRYLEAAPVKWAKGTTEDDPRARMSTGYPKALKGLSPENLGPGLGRDAWEKVKDYRCGDCISDLIATYNQGAIQDWYLPNKDEMEILIKSNIGRIKRNQYWTATGDYSRDLTPRMVMFQYTPKTGIWASTAYWFQTMPFFFIPIRAFSATPIEMEQQPVDDNEITPTSEELTETTEQPTENTITTLPSLLKPTGELNAPRNLQVSFNNETIEVTFDLQNEGLAPEGHFVFMEWSLGQNSMKLQANENSASTVFPYSERGKSVTVFVQSYSNATSPSQTAKTPEITVEVPSKETIEKPQIPDEKEEINNIGVLNIPLLNLPPEEVEGDIDPENIVNTINSQLPETEIKKIEILTNNPKVEDEEKFVEISQSEKTPYVIPPEATELTIRVTGTEGEVIEQTKLIVRIADNGLEIAPDVAASAPATTVAPGTSETKSSSTTTKPDSETESETSSTTEGETVDTTVVPEQATDSSDLATDSDSSGTNPIVWLLIAIIALLLAGFAAQRLKKTKN